jgi:hypothetical protein
MDELAVIFLLLIALAIIVCGPLVTIWAINLLFGLTIPMNIGTWFASLWLGGIVGNASRVWSSSKEK